MVTQFYALKEVVDYVKAIDKNIITIIGGGLVTYSPQEAMEGIENADIGIIGEGEITFYNLVNAIENELDISTVSGIVYREYNLIAYTQNSAPIEDLNILPFPDWDGFKLFEMENYSPTVTKINNIVSAPIVTSRGCPFQCTYCSKSGGGVIASAV